MKILYILPEYLPDTGGGITTHYRYLLPELARAGHEIHVVVTRHDTIGRPQDHIDGVTVTYLEATALEAARRKLGHHQRNPTLWAFLPLAWAAFHQTKAGAGFDLVETTDWMLLGAPWVTAPNAPPTVVSLHGSCGQVDWHEGARAGDGDIARLLETEILTRATGIHANSKTNAEFWMGRTSRTIDVLPPAFPVPELARSAPQQRSPRGIVVARRQNWKGIAPLCRALRLSEGIEVDWYGQDMPWESTPVGTTEKITKQYPEIIGQRLHLHPPCPHDQILQLIGSASFLCVPSLWDVFNLTAAEAMALGTPVVCSDAAGAAMLIDSGINGFTFQSDDPNSLAKQLHAAHELSALPPGDLVTQARDAVQSTLSPPAIACATIERYRQLLETNGPATPREDWLANAVGERAPSPAESTPRTSLRKRLDSVVSRIRAKR